MRYVHFQKSLDTFVNKIQKGLQGHFHRVKLMILENLVTKELAETRETRLGVDRVKPWS